MIPQPPQDFGPDPFERIETTGSSNLRAAAYNPQSGTLEVTFTDGSVYHHYDVDPRLWEAMKDFKSHGSYGSFFAANVKGQYPYERKPLLER